MSVFLHMRHPPGSSVSPWFAGRQSPFSGTAALSSDRQFDFAGLPSLGPNECLFHASFRVVTEGDVRVEGVVAASHPLQAGSRLLAAEAQSRQVSYDELFRASSFPEARRISTGEALALVAPPPATMLMLPPQGSPGDAARAATIRVRSAA